MEGRADGLQQGLVGSGLGALSAYTALCGARSVLGVDVWDSRVQWSSRKLAERFPELTNVRFSSTTTDKMDGSEQFDAIVSQNTFEHIADIDAVLASFSRLLKPGGRAYIGFSPLYHSPFGDHGELRSPVKLPWLHLVAGRQGVIAAYNKANRERVSTLQECGFNGLKPNDFRKAFARCGLEIERLLVNRTDGKAKQLAMSAVSMLTRIRALEPYFTTGMYVTLRSA